MERYAQPLLAACRPVPRTLSRQRLILGLLALSTALLATVFRAQIEKNYPYVHDFHDEIDNPVLAIELARSGLDLRGILTPQNPRYIQSSRDLSSSDAQVRASASLRTNTYEDFAFILSYSLFLWEFGDFFSAPSAPARNFLGLVVLLTACFDVMENFGILRVLGTPDVGERWNQLALHISVPSRIKWSLLGLALFITARILSRSATDIYSIATRRLLAIGYVVAAGLLWMGIIPYYSDLIKLGVTVFSLLVVINLFALLGPYIAEWFPGRTPHYVEDFCARQKEGEADVAIS